MPTTALDLPPDALKRYRPSEAIRRRKAAVGAEVLKRRRRAALAARRAARLLHRDFGAHEVWVFGSLARHGSFTAWSDIDLAARGIPPGRFFEAVGAITGLSAEFKIDLIDLDGCPAAMREAIEAEGKPL